VITVLGLVAVIALPEMPAARGGATGDEVVEGPAVRREQTGTVRLAIGGPRHPDDVGQFEHGRRRRLHEAVHQVLNRIDGPAFHLGGEVRVERGGLGARVTQIRLNQSEVDVGFERMGGVRMSKRVDVGALGHARPEHRAMERGLEAGARDWSGRRHDAIDLSLSGVRGKEPLRRAMGAPEVAQQREGRRHNGVMAVSFRRRGKSLRQSEYRQTHGGIRRPRETSERYTIRRRRIEFNDALQRRHRKQRPGTSEQTACGERIVRHGHRTDR